eukprot:jgi/Psemu1/15980/gm1.15980_g
MDAARKSATRHFYKPESEQSMSSPKPIKTPVFRAAQFHGIYFNKGCARCVSVCDLKKEGTKKETCNESHKENDHICLKWHSATKAQSAQELIEVMRDPTANPPPSTPTPEKIEEADPSIPLIGWSPQFITLPPKYKDDNHFKQDWFIGIYVQPMINHCPEWVDDKPTCATNCASMEFPIFARNTEDMEESAVGPDIIQLAQSWESQSTINSKAT